MSALSPDTIATLLAALLAIGVATVGVLTQRRIHKREHTLTVLAHLLTTDQIIDGRNVLRRLRNENALLTADTVTPAEMDRVNAALQYYEFVANAFFRGDLDRATVLDQLEGSFLLTHAVAEAHIRLSRERHGRPTLFAGIERMAERIRRSAA